ncbi:MAG: hypothetical protein KBH85_05245, partial [Lachnospiraceae bacterium]|nr:hypothetical protein [Lachnospiraceae bacterium]
KTDKTDKTDKTGKSDKGNTDAVYNVNENGIGNGSTVTAADDQSSVDGSLTDVQKMLVRDRMTPKRSADHDSLIDEYL